MRRPIPPLKIAKGDSNLSLAIGSNSTSPRFYSNPNHSQMTPPMTPHALKEGDNAMYSRSEPPRAVFHNYLRAFYPFHPSGDVSPSTVTLPLDQGDIILVHSVHINGWADGTLLDTGARGWLPTNYCEAYDQLPMRPLLKALTDFWDIIRGGCGSSLRDFGNQDLMRGLIAGVRFLLVSINYFGPFFLWSVVCAWLHANSVEKTRKNQNVSHGNPPSSSNMMGYAKSGKACCPTCHPW